jgi:hypothetical protein
MFLAGWREGGKEFIGKVAEKQRDKGTKSSGIKGFTL